MLGEVSWSRVVGFDGTGTNHQGYQQEQNASYYALAASAGRAHGTLHSTGAASNLNRVVRAVVGGGTSTIG